MLDDTTIMFDGNTTISGTYEVSYVDLSSDPALCVQVAAKKLLPLSDSSTNSIAYNLVCDTQTLSSTQSDKLKYTGQVNVTLDNIRLETNRGEFIYTSDNIKINSFTALDVSDIEGGE